MTTRTSAYTVTTSVWGHEGQSHTDPYPQRDGDYYGYPTTPRVDHYPSSGHWEEPTTGQHGSFEQVTTSKQKNTYHKRANYSQDSRHQQNEEYRQNDQNGPYSEEDAHNEQDPRYEAISPFDYPTSPPELSTSPSISSGSSIATLDAQFQGSYFTDVRRPVNVKSRDAGLAYLGSSFDNMHISPGYSTRVEVGSYDDDGLIGSDETLGQAEWCATTGPLPTSTQVSDPYGNAYADQQEYYEETPDNEDELAISDEVDALFADAENTVTKRGNLSYYSNYSPYLTSHQIAAALR